MMRAWWPVASRSTGDRGVGLAADSCPEPGDPRCTRPATTLLPGALIGIHPDEHGVIASRSPDAVRAAKRLLNASGLVPLQEGLANEFRASASLMGGANQIEAVMARLQRREPKFVDPET